MNALHSSPLIRPLPILLAVAVGCLLYSSALAQEAILPLPEVTTPTQSTDGVETNTAPAPAQPDVFSSPPLAVASPDSTVSLNGHAVAETPRRFKYSFGLSVRGVYDDNINISSSNRISGYYTSIDPFITLGLGDPGDGFNFLNFIYRPSIFLYLDHSANNSVQHIIHLDGQRRFSRLVLSLTQEVQILDGANLNSLSDPTGNSANVDVGGRARHQLYTSALNAAYDLSGKIFLSGGGNFSADEYETQISSEVYSGNFFVNYRYSDKVVIGLGGTGGLNTTSSSPGANSDQTFEQANVRLTYNATAKISLSASGGVEFRQFGGDSNGTKTSPVYELSASYQPFDGTTLAFNGSRHTSNSAVLAGQDFSTSTINFTANQRLLRRVSLGLALGYENNDYFSAVQGVSANRTDNYYYAQPALDVSITRFWAVGAYYLHRQNDSSLQEFQFHNDQAGIRTSISF